MTSNLPSPAPDAADAKANYLLETIVRDVQSGAMQIGAVAALLSRHAQTGDPRSLAGLRHYLHDDSRVSQLALRYGAEAGLSGDLQKALQAHYDFVATARRELLPLTKGDGSAQTAAANLTRWRRLAVTTRDILKPLQALASRRLEAVFAEDSAILQSFLQDVAEGGRDRFDASGAFSPPALRQRRKSARLDLRLSCEIAHAGGVVRGEIMNISATGVGLRSQTSIAMGQEIEVRLPDGRALVAKVSHCERGVIGARNKKTLTDADILAISKL